MSLRTPVPKPDVVHPRTLVQTTIDDLGTPLAQVTFVVVDLETTGGSPRDCAITEIGAVKVRGGQVLGELSTLVNPSQPIPPFIAALTGITDAMVAGSPRIEAVLPAWFEFSRGAVIVAHNARFDVGFLRAAAERSGVHWQPARVLDTVHLARHVLGRGEVRNHKLATLAPYFHATTTPNHRALDDARATVDVLHGLIERVGNLGVHTWEDLYTYTSRVSPETRRKRYLAEGLPTSPGVYVFTGPGAEVLYVGTSANLRSRVRTYFTAGETRPRMAEMVRLATAVTPIPCQTRLEAQIRELRLIAEHHPRYNRRSKYPARAPWVKLTAEPFPRLSVVRDVKANDGTYLGPFGSAGSADAAIEALHEAFPLRQCRQRIPLTPSPGAKACILAEIGRCGAPCIGQQSRSSYEAVVARVRRVIVGAVTPVADALLGRIHTLSAQQRFEDAARHRDRLESFLHAADRTQRRAPLESVNELVAARRREAGGWELVLVRRGQLAGTVLSPAGADPMPYVQALQASGDVPGRRVLVEETELIGGWLAQPGVRLVELDGEWSSPVAGAGQAHSWLKEHLGFVEATRTALGAGRRTDSTHIARHFGARVTRSRPRVDLGRRGEHEQVHVDLCGIVLGREHDEAGDKPQAALKGQSSPSEKAVSRSLAE